MALTTVERVRAYLGTTDEQNASLDAVMATIIASADKWFEEQTGRALASAARTESQVYRGRGCIIIPRYYPVTAVSTVTIDGAAVTAAGSWSGSGWFLVNDQIHLRGTEVEQGSLVALAYTAGFVTVPEDLAQAATELVALKLQERKHIGSQTQNMSGFSVTWLPAIVPQTVRDVVESYRVPGVA